jgi:16S rRNA (guanine527-N7)-methyltransferase
MVKRTNFLEEVLRWEDAPSSANVINGRVEVLARLPELEEGFELVTARSFGPPAVTAECAARLLRLEGLLIVSEPPDDEQRSRWDSPGLAKLGFRSEGRVRHGAAFQVIRKIKATPRMFPREVGVPGKNPLF